MIYDKLENINRYPFLNKIKDFDFKKAVAGKFEIEADNFFGIGLTYTTKPESECLWESHIKYLDIHVLLEGEEVINITEAPLATITKPYDDAGDYILHKGDKQQNIILKPGNFLALYPNEAHQTAVQLQQPTLVNKIVFKIKL